jgi:hypothetical protein
LCCCCKASRDCSVPMTFTGLCKQLCRITGIKGYVGCPTMPNNRFRSYFDPTSILLRSYLGRSIYTSVASTRREEQSTIIEPECIYSYFLSSLVSLPTNSLVSWHSLLFSSLVPSLPFRIVESTTQFASRYTILRHVFHSVTDSRFLWENLLKERNKRIIAEKSEYFGTYMT